MTQQIDLNTQVHGYYYGTQSAIEALTGVPLGSMGYAIDRPANQHFGTYGMSGWEWNTGGSGAAWGDITGTLSNQNDLQTALDGKAPSSQGVTNGNSHDHVGGDGAQINHDNLSNLTSNYSHPQYLQLDGWFLPGGSWSYSSADAPTFVVSVNADMTGTLSAGMRIRLIQTTSKYFIVTNVGSYSGGATLITLYGGTDYVLANASISGVYASPAKAPLGFPNDPDKWTVSIITTDTPAKASPTASTWYGGTGLSPTGPSIDLPIGSWRVFYRNFVQVDITLVAVNTVGMRATLSTANNSESDIELSTTYSITLPIGTDVLKVECWAEKFISVASKTTYYLNIFTGTGSVTTLSMNPGAVFKNIIKAVCSYL